MAREALASISARITQDQLRWLNERADVDSTTLSDLIREAIDGLRGRVAARGTLAGVEISPALGAEDRVEVVVKLTDGQVFVVAFDSDQARGFARQFEDAADRVSVS